MSTVVEETVSDSAKDLKGWDVSCTQFWFLVSEQGRMGAGDWRGFGATG